MTAAAVTRIGDVRARQLLLSGCAICAVAGCGRVGMTTSAGAPAAPRTATTVRADVTVTGSTASCAGRTRGQQLAAARLKAARFGPKFAAHRPSGDPAATIAGAWGDWLKLAVGDGLDVTDPAAIIVRRELPDGRTWGSTSVTLVALATTVGTSAIRYDFLPNPADPNAWYPVPI